MQTENGDENKEDETEIDEILKLQWIAMKKHHDVVNGEIAQQ
jgi:hypothetical protein